MSPGRRLDVGRLVAEFGVIVVGVLVALLAESAWAERGERVEEREALERVRVELATDSMDLLNDEMLVGLLLSVQADAAGVIEGTSALSDREALAILYASVLVNNTLPEEGTWQDLVSSGRTDLVSDPGLRGLLMTFFSHRERLQRDRDALRGPLRSRVIAALPVTYTQAVLDHCIRRDADARQLQGPRADAVDALRSCDVAPEGGARRYLDRILELPDVDLALGELRYRTRTFDEQVGRVRASLDLLTARLDDVLGSAG